MTHKKQNVVSTSRKRKERKLIATGADQHSYSICYSLDCLQNLSYGSEPQLQLFLLQQQIEKEAKANTSWRRKAIWHVVWCTRKKNQNKTVWVLIILLPRIHSSLPLPPDTPPSAILGSTLVNMAVSPPISKWVHRTNEQAKAPRHANKDLLAAVPLDQSGASSALTQSLHEPSGAN